MCKIFNFICPLASSPKKKKEEKEKVKPVKKKSIFKNKILLLKCKKLGGSKTDKCTNTCCDKGTNTLQENHEEVTIILNKLTF